MRQELTLLKEHKNKKRYNYERRDTMKFVMPEIEIIKFAEKDIITTSNTTDDDEL